MLSWAASSSCSQAWARGWADGLPAAEGRSWGILSTRTSLQEEPLGPEQSTGTTSLPRVPCSVPAGQARGITANARPEPRPRMHGGRADETGQGRREPSKPAGDSDTQGRARGRAGQIRGPGPAPNPARPLESRCSEQRLGLGCLGVGRPLEVAHAAPRKGWTGRWWEPISGYAGWAMCRPPTHSRKRGKAGAEPLGAAMPPQGRESGEAARLSPGGTGLRSLGGAPWWQPVFAAKSTPSPPDPHPAPTHPRPGASLPG